MVNKIKISLLWGMLFFSSHLVFAQSTNIPDKPKPKALEGIHFVFDASESICGYFAGPQVKNPLLALIKTAVSGKNPSVGNQVFLLKQTVKSKPVASRDIVVAPADIQNLSLNLKSSETSKSTGCQPFNGVDSNIELIFDPKSPTQDADAVLLVTDAQLVNTDRDKFVDGYANWLQDNLSSGRLPYAGVAFVEVEFAGRYFPIANGKSAYSLGTHNRPLMLFWFAKSDKHLSQIQSVVSSFAPDGLKKSKDAFIQHLWPTSSQELSGFQWKPNFNPPLSTLIPPNKQDPLIVANYKFEKFDNGRVDIILENCLHTSVGEKGITVLADAKCKDGKNLFDGVTKILINFKTQANSGFSSSLKPNGKVGELNFILDRGKLGKSEPFELQHTLTDNSASKVDLKIYSLDTDNCDKLSMDQCRAFLAAKTYQLDVLFAQLFERQKQSSSRVLDTLNSAKYTIEFKSK